MVSAIPVKVILKRFTLWVFTANIFMMKRKIVNFGKL